jgi:hypothetical protein
MTEPTVIIGRESRDARASVGKAFEQTLHGRFTPGPAYYTPASGHGKQVYSGKANPPAIGFCKEMLYTDPKVREPLDQTHENDPLLVGAIRSPLGAPHRRSAAFCRLRRGGGSSNPELRRLTWAWCFHHAEAQPGREAGQSDSRARPVQARARCRQAARFPQKLRACLRVRHRHARPGSGALRPTR